MAYRSIVFANEFSTQFKVFIKKNQYIEHVSYIRNILSIFSRILLLATCI